MTKRFKLKPGIKLFLATTPILFMYAVLCYLPLEGWKYAFFDYRPGWKFEECEFIGLDSFKSLFANAVVTKEILRVLRNTLAMKFIEYLTCFVPMFFAIFLSEIRFPKFKRLVQTFTTIPYFISWLIVYSIMTSVFAKNTGVFNELLVGLGILDEGINVLNVDGPANWVIMTLMGLWKGVGYSAIVYLSAINGIDQEMYEASMVDGANRFQKMWYITIPSLMPTFITLLILSMGGLITSDFGKIFAFHNAYTGEYIETIDYYVYKVGMVQGSITFSTTVCIISSVVGVVMLVISNWLSGKVRGEKIF